MTKDVLISISGVQMAEEENNDVEMITAGSYYCKDGKHYIMYDEVMEGFQGVIKNTIKICDDRLDIIKKGITDVHMEFEKDKKNISCYLTPFGEMMVGIHTSRICIDENEHNLKVKVAYTLDLNYEQVSECNIMVEIQSRSTAQFHLTS